MRHDTPASARSVANALVRLAPSLALDTRACFSVTTPGAPCAAAEGANLRDVFMPRDAELLAGESFGSAGPLLVPAALLPQNMGVDDGHPLAALGGRDGFFYLVDRARMGGVGPSPLRGDADIAGLVGAELYGRALFLHSPTGGIRAGAAYFEAPSGRYLYVTGHDEITTRADAPRGLAALRLASVRDPTPAECAAQYRRIGYGGRSLPCATIWGDALRPGFELAWSGAGTLAPGAPFVSSDGHANGIVWVSHQGAGDTRGLLEAWTADAGPGIDRVAAPLYRSDRAPSDLLPHATASAGPIVANGRVYVTGDNVTAYGLLAARALPPMSAREPPPCEPGVTWSTHGRPFVSRYCADCHEEYLDLALLRRRRLAIAETIVPASLVAPTMPLRGAPAPSRDERARVAAWLRCGAPGVALRTPPIVAQYGCSASPRATSRGGLALMALALACCALRRSARGGLRVARARGGPKGARGPLAGGPVDDAEHHGLALRAPHRHHVDGHPFAHHGHVGGHAHNGLEGQLFDAAAVLDAQDLLGAVARHAPRAQRPSLAEQPRRRERDAHHREHRRRRPRALQHARDDPREGREEQRRPEGRRPPRARARGRLVDHLGHGLAHRATLNHVWLAMVFFRSPTRVDHAPRARRQTQRSSAILLS
jgi:hypothetical protein